jgi:hypothetical protein
MNKEITELDELKSKFKSLSEEAFNSLDYIDEKMGWQTNEDTILEFSSWVTKMYKENINMYENIINNINSTHVKLIREILKDVRKIKEEKERIDE